MTRTAILGALLALVLGGLLAWVGGLGEALGGTAQAAESAVGPTAVGPGAAVAPTGPASDPRALATPVDQERGADTSRVPDAVSERAADADAPAGSAAGAPVTPARLFGSLRGPAGAVLGAQVTLVAGREGGATSIDTASSDVEGAFQLRTARLGGGTERLELEVRARGFAPYRVRVRRLIPGESRNLGTLQLQPGRVLDVDVTDQDGRPLGGAEVLVTSTGSSRGNAFAHSGVTADHGRVRFADAPLGTLRIQASAPGNGMRVLEHEHDGGGKPLRLALLPERSLALRLVAPDEAGIADALVSLTATERRHESVEAKTDAEGRVRFEGLGSERFDVRIVAAGYRTDIRRALAADGDEQTLRLVAWPCLDVQVFAPQGETLPAGTLVRAVPNTSRAVILRRPSEDDARAVAPDEDGRARLCDLRPGEYVVRIDAPGFAPTLSDPVRVRLDEPLDVQSLFLHRGGALALRVEGADGSPLVGARVELHAARPAPAALVNETPAFSAAILQTIATDAAGTARFERLASGDYTLLVRAEAHLAQLTRPLFVPQGGAAPAAAVQAGTLELQRGAVLRGQVRRAGGSPLIGALVVLRGSRTDSPVQLSTDGQGRFTSPPLPPGRWLVQARLLSGAGRSSEVVEREVMLALDAEDDPLDLVLE